MRRDRHLVLAVVLGLTLVACAAGDEDAATLGRLSSRIVEGMPSTAEEDFTVLIIVEPPGGGTRACGGVLVAPNLVLTARHCVSETSTSSRGDKSYDCDASGEPRPGGGGFVTAQLPFARIHVIGGVDAYRKWDKKTDLGVSPSAVIDDGSSTLCSHDFAAVVLATPLPGLPLAKLRLQRRPKAGPDADRFAVTGWGGDGDLVGRFYDRKRRDDLVVLSVGAPQLGGAGEGALPRTFKTTLGACTEDSGGPAFDPANGALAGVITHGSGFADNATGSRCLAPGATITHALITDFGDVLHRGFAAAGALPVVEGRPSPGWLSFADKCSLDVECGSNVCEGTPGAKTCNVDCRTEACPADLTCDASSRCSKPAFVPPASEEPAPQPAPLPARGKTADDCAVAAGHASMVRPSALVLLLAFVGLVVRRRRRPSSCPNGSSSLRS